MKECGWEILFNKILYSLQLCAGVPAMRAPQPAVQCGLPAIANRGAVRAQAKFCQCGCGAGYPQALQCGCGAGRSVLRVSCKVCLPAVL